MRARRAPVLVLPAVVTAVVAALAFGGCAGSELDVLMVRPEVEPQSDGADGAPIDTGISDVDPETIFDVPATTDVDGDGYVLDDDCDDGNALINPGAIEVPGDGVDNDCNGKIDEPPVECDVGLALATSDAMDFARSLGLCQQTTSAAKGKARKWGVISASIETSDGIGAPLPRQYGIQSTWGSALKPRSGNSIVVLSSGVARTPGQPGYVDLPKGTDCGTNVNKAPPGWPRNSLGCPVSTVKSALDSVALKLVVRVPTNSKSFSYDFDFYTTEYVEYACQVYNDSYVALLQTKASLDPAAGGNISYDAVGDPINVNSSFFEVCYPDSWLSHTFACPLGVKELVGTGYDGIDKSFGKPARNGATSWLMTTQPVVPGEEITLRLVIWNTGDHWLPSAVVIDDFKWSADPTTKSVTSRPK